MVNLSEPPPEAGERAVLVGVVVVAVVGRPSMWPREPTSTLEPPARLSRLGRGLGI
jgi:hypothetical protein